LLLFFHYYTVQILLYIVYSPISWTTLCIRNPASACF